jgi:hypothetical protein
MLPCSCILCSDKTSMQEPMRGCVCLMEYSGSAMRIVTQNLWATKLFYISYLTRNKWKPMVLFILWQYRCPYLLKLVYCCSVSCQCFKGDTLLCPELGLMSFPIQGSISEICVLISMLGRDVHMNVYQSVQLILLALVTCYLKLYSWHHVNEREVKWNHEPRSV